MDNRASKNAIIFFIIYAAYIIFIFSNSMDTADQSSAKSGMVLKMLNDMLFGGNAVLTEHIVRKMAHFSEFALLGLWGSVSYYFWSGRLVSCAIASLFTGLLTALTDETIQLFVPGRSSQVTDVWIDFAGVLAGTVIFILLRYMWQLWKGSRTGIQL